MAVSAHAGFSSIYIFGDSVSSTTSNAPALSTYYGLRYCNGRTWVEDLAQRLGLGATSIGSTNWNYSSNNLSFYGHYSPIMVTNVLHFTAPANATNCLFVVWVCNADFVGDLLSATVGDPANAPNNGTNLSAWTTAINQHLTNNFRAITNLYAKGCRTLIAPNAVDITEIPEFNNTNTYVSGYKAFVRGQITNFNASFAIMLNRIATNSPGLNIYSPDIFSLLDDIDAHASKYGLTNALDGSGFVMAVLDNGSLSPWNLNGPGTNYIFWDHLGDPTAKFQEVIADTAQQMVAPVQFSGIAPVGASNQLNILNTPVGLNGTVLFATNLMQTNWLTNSTFTSLTVTQAVYVSPTNSARFYQLKFPYQWTYP
jgi:phospholipase/lecithinase/hemolysin